jgi:hypothetical protein
MITTALNAYYGSDGDTGFAAGSTVSKKDAAFVLDWTATLVANEMLTFWANADYGVQQNVAFSAPNPQTGNDSAPWLGLALGTQLNFGEKTTFALRGEYLRDSEGYRIVAGNNTDAYSLTGTLGYKLTPNLLTRAEFRWDVLTTDGTTDQFFPSHNPSGFNNEGFQSLVQIAYIFD